MAKQDLVNIKAAIITFYRLDNVFSLFFHLWFFFETSR